MFRKKFGLKNKKKHQAIYVVLHLSFLFISGEMTYVVSFGALNSTHSLLVNRGTRTFVTR